MNISKSILLAGLSMSLPVALVAEFERVVIAYGTEVGHVNDMLKDGWSVKSQSSTNSMHVFTLTPPTAEVVAAKEARKKAEWQKKREEYLKSKQVEAP